VYANVKVNVARSADEAERQAKGENVVSSAAEADRAQAAEQAKELAASAFVDTSPRD
jgi:large subunit ribosomal protein L9